MTDTLATDLAFAHRLADAADEVTVSRFLAVDLDVRDKADATPVSDADTTTERTLRSLIAAEHPDDDILGEEYGGARHGHREWILDPIDGTANYVRGVPVWATLIALAIDGVPQVGVVSAPALGWRWWASAGAGAWRRRIGFTAPTMMTPAGSPLHVSAIHPLSEAFLSYNGMSYWEAADQLDALLDLVHATGRNRAFGDFWGYMLVAEGAIDLAGEWGLQPYDIAAVDVIVREAGGRFTDMSGKPGIWGGSALASNGLVHDAAVATINRTDRQ